MAPAEMDRALGAIPMNESRVVMGFEVFRRPRIVMKPSGGFWDSGSKFEIVGLGEFQTRRQALERLSRIRFMGKKAKNGEEHLAAAASPDVRKCSASLADSR